MTDDKLLEALARKARDRATQDPLDERWDALAAGRLEEDQVQALAALAARGAVPADAPEAFRPLDEDFRRAVAERAAAALEATDAGAGDSGASSEPLPFPPAAVKPRARTFFAPLAMAASLMLAVGIGFLALPGSPVQPLPGYSALLQGGASTRSGPDPGTVLRAGDRFELRLVPETAVDGPLTTRMYLDTPGGLTPLATPPATIAPSGAARIVGQTGADVLLPAGESRLVVVLARDTALPDEKSLRRGLAAADTADGKGWRAWRLTVTVEP